MQVKTLVIAIVALIALILGAYFLVVKNSESGLPGDSSAYGWEFTERDPLPDGTPRTQVNIVAGAYGYSNGVGTYNGTCSVQAGDYLPNEKSKVVCRWAGGGKEIGLFEEGGQLVVKAGDIDEGTAEEAGYRGNFELVEAIR